MWSHFNENISLWIYQNIYMYSTVILILYTLFWAYTMVPSYLPIWDCRFPVRSFCTNIPPDVTVIWETDIHCSQKDRYFFCVMCLCSKGYHTHLPLWGQGSFPTWELGSWWECTWLRETDSVRRQESNTRNDIQIKITASTGYFVIFQCWVLIQMMLLQWKLYSWNSKFSYQILLMKTLCCNCNCMVSFLSHIWKIIHHNEWPLHQPCISYIPHQVSYWQNSSQSPLHSLLS